jgi:cytochrome c peroxidase
MKYHLFAGFVVAVLFSSSVSAQQRSAAETRRLFEEGERLFFEETFGGNGRTCGTCHPATNNFTIDAAFIKTLPDNDPLFVHEFNPDLEDLEVAAQLRGNALICENQDGLNRQCNLRGVPHIVGLSTSIAPDDQQFPDGSSPAHALGWSADGSPDDGSLRQFAKGAVIQHFPRTLARQECTLEEFQADPNECDFRLPTDSELDAMEVFQRGIGRRGEVNIANLKFNDLSAQIGRDLFQGVGTNRSCAFCHFNAGANSDGGGNANFDTGTRKAALSPRQPIPDGGFGQDDQGLGGFGDGTMNVPPLVEAADTAPFFHNNSAATLEAAIEFYTGDLFAASPSGVFGGGRFDLDEIDVDNIAAFLRALSGRENAERARELVREALRSAGLGDIQAAAAEVNDGIEVLEASDLSPNAVAKFEEALGFLDTALNRTGRQRDQALRSAQNALVGIPNLIANGRPILAGN